MESYVATGRNEVLITLQRGCTGQHHAEQATEPGTRDHNLHDPTGMACPEQVKPQRWRAGRRKLSHQVGDGGPWVQVAMEEMGTHSGPWKAITQGKYSAAVRTFLSLQRARAGKAGDLHRGRSAGSLA